MLPPRIFPLFLWILGLLGTGVTSARAELVYANTNQFLQLPATYRVTNAYTVTVPDGQGGTSVIPAGQIGDSIRLTRAGDFAQFRFSYLTGLAQGATLAGTSLVLRFYANDGPQVNAGPFGPVNLPGTLLYESDSFALEEGVTTVTLNNVPGLFLPQDITWAVEYRNVDPADVVLSFPAYDPPSLGSNPAYYLALDAAREWVLYPPADLTNPNPPGQVVAVPGNFPADLDFVPIPEPGAAALAALGTAAFLLRPRRSRPGRCA